MENAREQIFTKGDEHTEWRYKMSFCKIEMVLGRFLWNSVFYKRQAL